MEYLKLQQKDTGDIRWIRASFHLRGVLVTMLMRCSALENNGRIADSRNWADSDWYHSFGVRLEDVEGLVLAGLADWDTQHLWLSMYDSIGQQRLETQRGQGHHGSKGGKSTKSYPKGNPKGSVKSYPKGNPHTTPHQCGEVSPKGSPPPAPLGWVAQGPEQKKPMDLRALMAAREKLA